MPRRIPQEGDSIDVDAQVPPSVPMHPEAGAIMTRAAPAAGEGLGAPRYTVTAFEKGVQDTQPKACDWHFETLLGWLKKNRRAKAKAPAWWLRKNPDAGPEEQEKARKLSHPSFAGYRIRPGGRRRSEDLEAFTLLILDVDNKCPEGDRLGLEEAAARLEAAGARAILYTSWSHSAEAPRFRVVLPLAEEVPAEDYRRWYPAALDALGWREHPALDQVVQNPAQAYLVPVRRKGAPAPEVLEVRGEALAVPVPPPEAPPAPRKPSPPPAVQVDWGASAKVPDGVLEEIRSRVSLLELLERRGVELKRQGRSYFALCPLPGHEEKTASFKVDADKPFFKCFGCQEGGDCFKLVQLLDGVDFPAAVQRLAAEAGVVLPDPPPPRRLPVRRKKRKAPKKKASPAPEASPEAELKERAQRLLDDHRLTDIGNGEWIAEEHRGHLRFCRPMRRWLVWDGTRWEVDEAGSAVRRAKDSILRMADAADLLQRLAQREDSDAPQGRVKKITAWIERSQAAKSVHNALEMAQTEPGIPIVPAELDKDPWLLNVANGTLDLRTGELRPHARDDLLTKLVPVRYDPAAACPRWDAFVAWAMRDRPDLIAYLQRAIGYALTGSTREQCFFFLHGSGANGKSTFVSVVQDLFGADYGQTMRSDVLLPKRFDSGAATPEIARLKGVRFVSSVETEEERKLAEALIKQLTGGDKITARYLNQNPIEFWPTHKIFMAGNHKPEIRGTDQAIWRRVHLVPFDAHLKDNEKDFELPAKLRAELPGILAWAVRGCLAWQAEGLRPPEEVRAATAAYRQEMDILGDFLEERCEVHDKMSVQARTLYQEYRDWCQDVGRSPYSETKFGRRLTTRGFQKQHSRTGKRYVGLGLKADDHDGYPHH